MDRFDSAAHRAPPSAETPAPSRRTVLHGLGAAGLIAALPGQVRAQDARYLRIATGSAAGTYYPVGETIARLLSHPPGLPPCDPGAACGVPGLVAAAETSEGSVANVEAVAGLQVETALAQADVLAWAHGARGAFEGQPPRDNLRVITSLYAESMHVVVRADSGVAGIGDLAGRRVSLDRPGSGTRGDAVMILDAYGIATDAVEAVDLGPSQAAAALMAGEIDAFFFLGGAPAVNVREIADTGGIALLPIDGPAREKLLAAGRYFQSGAIAETAYPGLPATETVNVSAQWICALEVDADLIYDAVRTLFDPVNREALDEGHPKAREITLAGAILGLGAPLHPGAVRFYREQGMTLPAEAI
ncbi:TAXI family TRAP transporter solute-binding subunit [Zavarzinia compransoris]|uniref:TAXI family TRAP transporter solute-binding subunit n=1 Tax=Zavarzinia marina TaxID=2911065 RepID=UPI001F3A0C3E|nr:TAXI family TRAP transporter solute-binding subunit [Zavarzinia marina]MCF4165807.1 TAXI family TRAP transporter solute-binding subunit [Zavarzinia marina]